MATYHAKAAAGIVLDVHSGEVVALASLPDYDPNHREQALDKDRLTASTSGVYEMGSVFKVFTVAGVLDAGLASLRSATTHRARSITPPSPSTTSTARSAP